MRIIIDYKAKTTQNEGLRFEFRFLKYSFCVFSKPFNTVRVSMIKELCL